MWSGTTRTCWSRGAAPGRRRAGGASTVDLLFGQARVHAGQHRYRIDLLDALEACVVVAQARFENAGRNVLETPATGPVVEVREHVTGDHDWPSHRIDQDALETDGVTGQGQHSD